MRRVLLAGVIGGLPGFFIAVVPVVLAELDVITSDQSQIGYAGIPLLLIGVFVGVLVGASESTHPGAVILGMVIGFVAGPAAGIAIHAMLRAAGMAVAGAALLLPAVAMIGGAATAASWTERSDPPLQAPTQP